jgi:hypothetical protein
MIFCALTGMNVNMNKFASLSVLDAEAINTKKMNASNPPTRKRNLLTVWMDPELWATLPEPLIEQVLAYLPLPILLQLRAVCKKWDALLRHPTFLRTQAQLLPTPRPARALLPSQIAALLPCLLRLV